MVVKQRLLHRVLCFMVVTLFCMSMASAEWFLFNGTVSDVNGNALNNTEVNVTVRDSTFTVLGSNKTTTNASGWFSLNVTGPDNAFYQPVITHTNTSESYVDYVGQALPSFPRQVFLTELSAPSFYLRPAGTLNITAVNASGSRTAFTYQVKDTRLGYPVAESFVTPTQQAVLYLPRDRNYSIMIYPNQSMPVSFDWNNFTSTGTYVFDTSNISKYNVTTRTLHKQFNTTLRLDRVSGYFNYTGITDWSEFGVVVYLVEPGNMVHATYGDLPFNLSSAVGQSDLVNATGFFNISIPATVETSNVLLYAAARNGSNYYGGFRNLSLSYNNPQIGVNNFNISAGSGILGVRTNITMDTLVGGVANVSTAKQTFTLVNATNSTLANTFAHIEATVNYSGAFEFTWMEEVQQSAANATFQLILLNNTNIKEINVFASGGQANYAPKRLAPTIAQVKTNANITMKAFNPEAIGAQLNATQISMALYTSNASCDVPDPASSCLLGGSEQTMESFKPMNALVGGGRLSFRMGTGNITVHYVNVDLIASGPPEALFDQSANASAGTTFDAAVRFGSGGPTIYDYILVSMPYSEGAGSGLNDGNAVNASVPVLYDENWNIIWNASSNGTNVSALAGNHSHYASRQGEWAELLQSRTCTTNVSAFNASNFCYINTTSNIIWIRLPHFSGAGPSVTGSVVASPSGSSGSTGGGGGGGSAATAGETWSTTFVHDDRELQEKGPVTRALKAQERIRVKIGGQQHHVGVKNLTATHATFSVESAPQSATLAIGESKSFEVTNDSFYDVKVTLVSISGTSAEIKVEAIREQVPSSGTSGGQEAAAAGGAGSADREDKRAEAPAPAPARKSIAALIITVVFALLIVGYFVYLRRYDFQSRVHIGSHGKSIKVR